MKPALSINSFWAGFIFGLLLLLLAAAQLAEGAIWMELYTGKEFKGFPENILVSDFGFWRKSTIYDSYSLGIKGIDEGCQYRMFPSDDCTEG